MGDMKAQNHVADDLSSILHVDVARTGLVKVLRVL